MLLLVFVFCGGLRYKKIEIFCSILLPEKCRVLKFTEIRNNYVGTHSSHKVFALSLTLKSIVKKHFQKNTDDICSGKSHSRISKHEFSTWPICRGCSPGAYCTQKKRRVALQCELCSGIYSVAVMHLCVCRILGDGLQRDLYILTTARVKFSCTSSCIVFNLLCEFLMVFLPQFSIVVISN